MTAALFAQDTPDARRIARALADLAQVKVTPAVTHGPDCWQWHVGCLAARTRRTLEGTDRNDT